MRVGLQVPNFTWPQGQAQLGDMFALIAERAERAGFYSMWVMDHFFQIPSVGPAENEMLEGWSALAFAAGHTNYIKLGTMVTGVTYRHPGVLVKTATTLDVLSHGRAYFGIGAAWNEEEHRGLGIPFPPLKERFERLEETLQIALRMWSESEEPYHGRYYTLERPLNSPQPVQLPHPPTLASRRRCGWWRNMAMPAISSGVWAERVSSTSSRCCASTASSSVAIMTISRRQHSIRCTSPATGATVPCRRSRPLNTSAAWPRSASIRPSSACATSATLSRLISCAQRSFPK